MILNHCQFTAKQTSNLQHAAKAPLMQSAERQPRPRSVCQPVPAAPWEAGEPGTGTGRQPESLPGAAGSVPAVTQALPQRRE